MLFLSVLSVQAETAESTDIQNSPAASTADPELRSVFSIDTSYLFSGADNNGWGIGITYEYMFFPHFSIKGGLSHMTFFTELPDVYCTSVGVSLFANYYFSNKGLSGFYAGSGCSTDFFNYFGSGDVPDPPKDTVICIGPVAGYKHTFQLGEHFKRHFGLMFDIYNGWQFLISNSDNLYNDVTYSQEGWLFGVKFKVLVGRK